jgi:hypothetical protein
MDVFPRPARRVALALSIAALVAGCSTYAGADSDAPPIPPGAVASTRTESNGDVVTEYRVGGAISMVRIVPPHGPTYYLTDSDGDGRLDRTPQGTRDAPVYFKLYGW